MSLEHPYLLALLPLALLPIVRLFRLPAGTPALAAPPQAAGGPSPRGRLLWAAPVLASLAAACGALAAAAPHFGSRVVPDPARARDIALVIDASESMRALDFELAGRRASRMEAAVRFASSFIAGRQGDRIAIVAFGGRAVTQCPLTFDRAIARRLLGYVEPEMLGKRTALGTGIALGVARLERGGALVLLTDGQNTAGDVTPGQAARAAAARGVKVYAVGVGTPGPAPVPARLPSGRVRLQMKDYPLDEAALRGVAEATGGRFFRAADAAALREVFGEIDRLEPRSAVRRLPLPEGRLGRALALVSAGCLVALLALSATVLRTAPLLR